MADPVLWEREAHTHAKHRVLRSYIDAWIPVIAQTELKQRRGEKPRLLMVDGFAGPGVYKDGEDGSPLIMLKALTGHKAFDSFGNFDFLFLFIEQDERRVERLKAEINKLRPLPSNVKLRIECGPFETEFTKVLDEIAPGRVLVPTFAFIDPFGYSHAPMDLAGRLLEFPRTEALFFLPLTHVYRFVGREKQDDAMMALFGTEKWREAIPLEGDERRTFLLTLFEDQLLAQRNVKYVRSFQLRTQDGNDYRLVFSLAHEKGLELAKDAMWKVDPIAGASYAARTETGQEVLFVPDDVVDTGPLLRDLRDHFGTEPFSIDAACDFTLFHTPFRHNGHLKRLTLAPAEKAGQLQAVDPKPTRRRGQYPTGTMLRFTA